MVLKRADIFLLLCVLARANASEPLRMPAQLPALEKRESWSETLRDIQAIGIPQEWQLIGPIKDQNFKQFDSPTLLPAEQSDDWTQLKVQPWTRPNNEEGSLVDLSEALYARYDVLAFAQTEVIWPFDGPALIWFDSIGRSTLYLNNTRVDAGPPRKRTLEPGADSSYPVEVQMKRGRNTLKIKVGQDRDPFFKGWGFYARFERHDLDFLEALFEKLKQFYPEEAAGRRGVEALLEMARCHEKAGRFSEAADTYQKALDLCGNAENEEYRIEADLGKQRCQERRKENHALINAQWQKLESRVRALILNGDSHSADALLREFIARNPTHDSAGPALALRGALRLDYCDTEFAAAFFERALREFSASETVRKTSLPGLALARNFRPDKIEVAINHDVQGMVDGMRRQIMTGFAHDTEAAAKTAANLVRDYPSAILRLSDSKLFPQYVGLREYVRALLAGVGGEPLAIYRNALELVSARQFEAAHALGGLPELEAVAWQFYYTPAAAHALNEAGNAYMDRGAYGQALHAFKLLQKDYASEIQKGGSISAPLLGAKIAYCAIQDGQPSAAGDALKSLSTEFAAATLTVGGCATTGAEYARALHARLNAPALVTGASAAELATYAGGATRTGDAASNETILKSAPAPWTQQLLRSSCENVARDYWPEDTFFAHLQSYPIISGDTAFVSTMESLQAFDVRSGKKLWHQTWDSKGSLFDDGGRPLFTGFPVSCPAATAKKVYVRALQGSQSSLRCYDSASGKLAWSTQTQGALKKMVWISEPLVAYGLVAGVYLENAFQLDVEPAGRAASYTHGVAAFDAESGELRWKTNLCTGTTGMRVVERVRGRGNNNKEWATYRSTMQLGPPAADNGIIYTQTGLGSIVALNAFTGEMIWLTGYPRVKSESLESGNSGAEKYVPRNLKILARGPASPVVGEEVVVIAPKDAGSVIAFERRSGKVRWMKDVLDCRYLAGVCDGKLLAVDDAVSAISMNTGRVEWEFKLPEYSKGLYAHPGFFGGLLYLPTKENLQVVDARTGQALKPVMWDPKVGPLANFAITAQSSIGVNGRLLAPIPVGPRP